MPADPEPHPSPSAPVGSTAVAEDLRDRVYRADLAEGSRGLRGTSPWITLPVTLALAGSAAGLALLLARGPGPAPALPPSVAVVLQEGPPPAAPGPVRAPVGPRSTGPAPAPPAPAPPAPAAKPVAVPVPVPVRAEAPAQAEPERMPEAAPREPARAEPARSPGGPGGGAGTGGGTGTGTGSGTGSGAGTGSGSGGAHAAPIAALDFAQMKVAYRPPEPPYPPLARMARIQGTVVVELTVGLDGVPLGAVALEGPYQLRAAAQAYAMAWRFLPTREGGQPVVSRFKLSVTYRLN